MTDDILESQAADGVLATWGLVYLFWAVRVTVKTVTHLDLVTASLYFVLGLGIGCALLQAALEDLSIAGYWVVGVLVLGNSMALMGLEGILARVTFIHEVTSDTGLGALLMSLIVVSILLGRAQSRYQNNAQMFPVTYRE